MTTDVAPHATRHLFFTGKGGVGKTTNACLTAVRLAEGGARVLLVSTDPASNLDEILGVSLSSRPTQVTGVPNLSALNINPEAAAVAYRERVVGPYRGILPKAAVASIEEQLSGACTVEIAAFDEFAKLIGSPTATAGFDHVIFDTAPTGHTLRLLELPTAWTGFLDTNVGGTSCLGPLAGLREQQSLYETSRRALADAASTTFILVARPEKASLEEADRTRGELEALGIHQQELLLNGLFSARDRSDKIAVALEDRCRDAVEQMPPALRSLPRTELRLRPSAVVSVDALRALNRGEVAPSAPSRPAHIDGFPTLESVVSELARVKRGVIMTMGKGGVGKTTVAIRIAVMLADSGLKVHLTTTDPAGRGSIPDDLRRTGLTVSRIDPVAETHAYAEEVLRTAGAGLDEKGRALLEEDLRSPCTEEIAVFRAFARVVDEAKDGVVVVDTAPTGHTLLLLDAAEAYHREVQRSMTGAPESVRALIPRLRDPDFTRIFLVTLPEPTPVHEAAQLQKDLARSGIKSFAWVINQSLLRLPVTDPVLVGRRDEEQRYLAEVRELSSRACLLSWSQDPMKGSRRDAGDPRYTEEAVSAV